jgi:hypothetical protein
MPGSLQELFLPRRMQENEPRFVVFQNCSLCSNKWPAASWVAGRRGVFLELGS